jgi:hypothetical protein
MAGLDPAIHEKSERPRRLLVGARHKAGHDDYWKGLFPTALSRAWRRRAEIPSEQGIFRDLAGKFVLSNMTAYISSRSVPYKARYHLKPIFGFGCADGPFRDHPADDGVAPIPAVRVCEIIIRPPEST